MVTLPADDARVALGLRFAIEIDAQIIANFSECSGLDATIQLEKWDEGGLNHTSRKFPSRTDFGNLTLKHGVTDGSDLYDWFLRVMQGGDDRKLVSVILMTEALEEIVRWEFVNAFPVKWSGPSLQAGSSGVSIETLELAHEGLNKI